MVVPIQSIATTASVDDEGMLRPARMSLIQLYVPLEVAQHTIAELGELGVCQFKDLNESVSAFQKSYTFEVRRLDDMERKIKFLISTCTEAEIPMRSWIGVNVGKKTARKAIQKARNMQELDELDEQLSQFEERIQQMRKNQKVLDEQHADLCEQRDVLVELSVFLEDISIGTGDLGNSDEMQKPKSQTSDGSTEELIVRDGENGGIVHRRKNHLVSSMAATTFIAGVIPLKKAEPFQRVMWRALRGNVIIRTVSLPCGKEEEKRSAFIVFCHGRETTERIKKMCVAMGCKLVDVPEEHSNRSTRYSDLITKIDDIQSILYNSRQALKTELLKISEGLEGWLVGVRRDKAVYAVLNMFSTVHPNTLNADPPTATHQTNQPDTTQKGLVGEAWVPTSQLGAVDEAVQRASSAAGLYAALPTIITALSITGPGAGPVPTHFRTTPMTQAFQEMTDAYGVPAYREINPALFMLASFPFLFAVMFGDVGHGAIMLAAGLFLCLFERQLAGKAAREEMFGMIFSGRYIVVLMGAASVFAGLIYNDFFARSLAIFPSAYTLDRRTGAVTRIGERVYAIGIDPIWNRASNALALTNSYKMKQSILLGLVQMTFGLFLSAANHLYERDFLSLFGSFLPQLIFFSSMFGYLGFLILVKWIWPKDVSLIIVFINMALGFGKVEGQTLFPGQATIQLALVCLAFVCIPWMFLSRPGWMLWQKWRRQREGYHLTAQATPELSSSSPSNNRKEEGGEEDHTKANLHEGEEGIGDCLMFSMIHTIEFILGSVSNTASYLRLWALSLAHAQLSEVLWDMVLEKTMSSPLFLVPGFAAWLTLTVCIMVVMEGLSAFLHALRLHWVEFNGKFYKGTGCKFAPLNTKDDHLVSQLIEEGSL